MNETQIGIISLTKSAITGEKAVISKDFDWQNAIKAVKKHQIAPLIYYGLINSCIKVSEDLLSLLENTTCQCIALNHNQIFELENIYKAFNESGIEYMPLKGAVLKKLYPKPEMRVMGDGDILIKSEQYEIIREAMQSLGYTEFIESDHELIWNKRNIHIELHKRLIPSYNKDYYSYYGDGWRFAKPDAGSCYKMSDEDTFVYIFTHYAKHYRDGGIGIRHITDLYIYLISNPKIDKKYIETELNKLGLLKFYKNTINTIDVWFNNKQANDISDFITDRIFESGSYGTYVSHILSGAVKSSNFGKNAKFKKIFNLIFPPYKDMSRKYPVLKKNPLLLPFMWISRIINILFTKKYKIAERRKELNYMSEENIAKYKKELNYVGIDFNFNKRITRIQSLEQRVLIELLAGEISGEERLCEEELKTVDWSEVLKEAKAQAVPLMAAEAVVKYKNYIPNYDEWGNLAATAHAINVRTAYNEQKLNEIMKGHPFVILKGMAAAAYYPKPHERSIGDIDFLIDPAEKQELEELLSNKGYVKQNIKNEHHVSFNKSDTHFEMHFEIPGIPSGEPGKTVREFMMNAFKHPVISQFDDWIFPAPKDIYHGLIILLHMQHHMLDEGLGLRHICDWACYVQKTEGMPFWAELLELFEKIGVLTYSKVVTKICSMYFHINCPKWAENADEELCNDVMNDVLIGGNFGRKDRLRSTSSLMISKLENTGIKRGKVSNLLWILHCSVLSKYPIIKKCPLLYPVFYCYRAMLYLVRMLLGKRSSFIKLAPMAKQRKSVYDRLHLFETENNGIDNN